MFRCCFCIKLVRIKTGNFNHGYFLQNPSLKQPSSQPFSSISAAANANQPNKQQPPCTFKAVDYLINSCGLSPERALSASNKLNLKTPEKPNSVLALLTSHGFNKTQIKNLITKQPRLLTATVDKNLKPKLQFFLGLGLPVSFLPELIVSNPSFFYYNSLKNKIIPSIDLLRGFLHTNDNIIKATRRCKWLLTNNLHRVLVPKVSILQSHGIPDSDISQLIMLHPRVLLIKSDRLNEAIERAKELGFDTRAPWMLLEAVKTICSMSKSSWDAKMEVFRSLGWSDVEIISAFKKQPGCMRCSEKKIRTLMDFFVNNFDLERSRLLSRPILLTYSLEARIIPRYRVMQILTSKNLVKKKLESVSFMTLSEKRFLDRYVTRYQKEVPDVLKAYMGRSIEVREVDGNVQF